MKSSRFFAGPRSREELRLERESVRLEVLGNSLEELRGAGFFKTLWVRIRMAWKVEQILGSRLYDKAKLRV